MRLFPRSIFDSQVKSQGMYFKAIFLFNLGLALCVQVQTVFPSPAPLVEADIPIRLLKTGPRRTEGNIVVVEGDSDSELVSSEEEEEEAANLSSDEEQHYEYKEEEDEGEGVEHDDEDGGDCNHGEILYIRSGQCVPAKCPRGSKHDAVTGHCDAVQSVHSSDGHGYGGHYSGSGSMYKYGRMKYTKIRRPHRTRLRYRLVPKHRPKQFAKWVKETHPDLAAQKPLPRVV